MTHRDPVQTVPSLASLVRTLHVLGSDAVDPLEIGAHWSRRWSRALERAIAARASARGPLPRHPLRRPRRRPDGPGAPDLRARGPRAHRRSARRACASGRSRTSATAGPCTPTRSRSSATRRRVCGATSRPTASGFWETREEAPPVRRSRRVLHTHCPGQTSEIGPRSSVLHRCDAERRSDLAQRGLLYGLSGRDAAARVRTYSSANSTTRVAIGGCSSAPIQRNSMPPWVWPAVSSQFG